MMNSYCSLDIYRGFELVTVIGTNCPQSNYNLYIAYNGGHDGMTGDLLTSIY